MAHHEFINTRKSICQDTVFIFAYLLYRWSVEKNSSWNSAMTQKKKFENHLFRLWSRRRKNTWERKQKDVNRKKGGIRDDGYRKDLLEWYGKRTIGMRIKKRNTGKRNYPHPITPPKKWSKEPENSLGKSKSITIYKRLKKWRKKHFQTFQEKELKIFKKWCKGVQSGNRGYIIIM